MPELPEIETIRMQLRKVLPGKIINKIEVLKPKSFQGKKELVEGKRVVGVKRLAKVLLIDLEGDIDIAIHFKMTGQLVWVPDDNFQHLKKRVVGGHPTADFVGTLPSKHTRVVLHMDSGTLYFNDQRIFGWVKAGTKEEIANMKFLKELGPEPMNISEEEFIKLISKRKKPVKLVLMDQTEISGVGNIYANDACWEAKVNPRRLANSLTRRQYQDLYRGVIKVLEEGIKYGGATAADAKYIDLHGLGGHYQEHFRVYDREGEECRRPACRQAGGGIIHRLALGGRGTYFCPKCQI
ncbi:MAG: Formamidopyrimidine-DNA glycosylase [Candidatus Amesbacteria bacterium GW2011_GWB1_47_19]|nr:MAG: Formamidopyrimidine-DNA glycosylase [Candidatus Amesbacteria bacterium GW2011_GWA1_44_24]KKU31880.1 MAG: hypothetical protein UX46_C0002G0096 [Candidatus Amesbacteria bacterium GW2011_GWC1_46_24]KKU66816.1 MAG: Formamidopyrimidine-DNA glycosylase [Candidatus Amesbacteria bacterium GW2011_GWB1_47_19]OGD05280.1 MAG: DNA-formamidopyrimidine glycosylase [Candidatus Amesbacteria bacterium RIFOXYB1_FULL_47_13]HBC73179.1 hypothetical protein [Candidatus Amesbacteria bacterium]